MALPEQFSESEHLQDLFRRYMNRQVRDFFADLGGDEWDPDISTSRGSLRHGCTHKDDDSLPMTLLRWELFNHVRRLRYDVPFYGIPVSSFQESRKFRPQIKLYFAEDPGDVEPGWPAVTGEITFRLMDHTSETITPTVATTFANRVKTTFGLAGQGYIWRKGKDMASYSDWGKGYQLQLLVRSDTEARELISKVLDIQNDSPSWSKMNYSVNEDPITAYPTLPDTDYIYGEVRRLPRRRPIASVRFQYALLHIHGVASPIVLYDRSYTHRTALVDIA